MLKLLCQGAGLGAGAWTSDFPWSALLRVDAEARMAHIDRDAGISVVFANVFLGPFHPLRRRLLGASVLVPELPDFAQPLHVFIHDGEEPELSTAVLAVRHSSVTHGHGVFPSSY